MKKLLLRIILTVILLLIIGGFIVVMHSSSSDIDAGLTNSERNTGGADYEYTSVISKEWYESDGTIGAEYDFYIYNNSLCDLSAWSVSLDVPDNCSIDSCWPGRVSINNNVLTYTPNFSDENFLSGTYTKFGFVMYSDNYIDTDHITLKAHAVYNYHKSPVYTMLNLLLFAWIIICIIYSFTLIKMRNMSKRQEHDHQIITQSIQTFVNFIDAKDPYTKGHSSRVARYSKEIAKRMKFSNEECQTIYYIALMHDVGKIAIPDSILNKDGALNSEEKEIVKQHTTKGGEMLQSFTSIEGIMDGALYHHERYDGNGYPSGLSGKDIPLYARIICIADSYDTMSSNRCYRSHLKEDVILNELTGNSGTQFDPEIVKYMIDMIHDGFVYTINSTNKE